MELVVLAELETQALMVAREEQVHIIVRIARQGMLRQEKTMVVEVVVVIVAIILPVPVRTVVYALHVCL